MKLKPFPVVFFAMLSLVACDPGGSMAHVSQPNEVAGCKPLGDVALDVDPDKYESNDQRVLALRKKATAAGATNVVWAPGDGTTMKGAMFRCPEPERAPTRSDQRAGF